MKASRPIYRSLLRILIVVLVMAMVGMDADAQRRKKRTRRTGSGSTPARTMEKVKKEQDATQLKISETSTRINTTSKELNRQLSRLNSLNADIEVTQANVGRLRSHIDSIGSQINVTSDSISILEKDLESLRRAYAQAMQRLQPSVRGLNNVSFIFSSGSFSEAWARVRYLRRFSRWRDHKAQEISSTIDRISERRQHLTGLRHAQDKAYRRAEQERATLARQQEESNRIVRDLRKEDSQLRAELARQKKQAAALDRELDRLIAAEQERIAREEEARRKKEQTEAQRRKSTSPASSAPKEQPATRTPAPATPLSGTFAQNKGKLLFPVAGSYKIVRKFGRRPHPTLKHVETDNAGIDIETSAGSGVRAVFSGTVSAIFDQPGFGKIVMLRHGKYLTIYAGLGSVGVRKGESVKTGQNLGSLAAADGHSILHFEIRDEKQKLNPSLWLR